MKVGDNSLQNNIFKLSTIASKRSPGQTLAFWVTTGNNIKFPTLQQQISLTDIPVGQQRALIPEKMKSLEIGVNIVKQPKEVPNIDQIEFQGSLFRNDYSDKMRVTYLLGMPVGFYENIGHANMMGIEGKIKMKAYGGRVFGDMAFSKYDKASSKPPSSNIMFPKLLKGSAKLGLRLVAFLKLFIASLILFRLWRVAPKLLYA